MKTKIITSLVAVLALAGLGVALKPVLFAEDGPPALPAVLPVAGVELLHVQPFELGTPATHLWRADQPKYTTGVLLVVGVDPDLAHPRQTAEPVLYVGNQTAERLNAGSMSGRLVLVVPTDGTFDAANTPIFFGDAQLPESVDAQTIARQLDLARDAGISGPVLAASTDTGLGNDPVAFDNDYQLRVFASDLIELHSPDEVDLISGLRATLLTR